MFLLKTGPFSPSKGPSILWPIRCSFVVARKESSIFPFTLIRHYVLTNLQFALKFILRFVIGECAFLGDEVEDGFVVTILTDVSPNQLRIPQQAP